MNACCLVKRKFLPLLRRYYHQNETLLKNCTQKTAKDSFKEAEKITLNITYKGDLLLKGVMVLIKKKRKLARQRKSPNIKKGKIKG